MLNIFSKIISKLPLPVIHHIGVALGWLIHFCTPATARIQRQNLMQSGLCADADKFKQVIRSNIGEAGKAILEALAIWHWPQEKSLMLVKASNNWHLVEKALAAGKGLIFLTPHLGCFEITSLYYGRHYPITVLYRPPKKQWLMPLVSKRKRQNIALAEANANGVRKLLKALKQGEAIGILPDQIPAAGEGEWADFFGKPAYTMTLASKLAEKTGAAVIMAFGERLDKGAGYVIHLTKIDSIATPALLNQAIEKQIAQAPHQYYWHYHRYKISRKSKAKLAHHS